MGILRSGLIIVGLIGFQSAEVRGSTIFAFAGTDPNATAPGTGSNTAASNFDTFANLIGPEQLINFESLTATNNAVNQTISLNAEVSVTGNTIDIRNAPFCDVNLCGANTTTGGSQWLDLESGTLTFTFIQPIQYFGAYLGGLQGLIVGQETYTLGDGSSQTVDLPLMNGGFAFAGFTEAGASISSITITAIGDIVSIDDVRYGPLSEPTVPEPSSLVLVALGFAGMAGFTRRKSKKYRTL